MLQSDYDYRYEAPKAKRIAICKKCECTITDDEKYYDFLSKGIYCFDCIEGYLTEVERDD